MNTTGIILNLIFLVSTPLYYNILDNENLKVTSADVDKRIEEMIEEYKNAGTNVTREQVVTLLGEYYFEALVISEKVADYLSTKATIK